MWHQASRHRLGTALLTLLIMLAGACSSGTNSKTQTGTAGLEQGAESSARIPVYVYNGSDKAVTLSISAKNNSYCPANKWEYKGEQKESGRLDPLSPRSTVEGLYIITSTCSNTATKTYDSTDAFMFGIEGASQFYFFPNFAIEGPSKFSFEVLLWRGSFSYSGGGNTGELVLYKSGSYDVLGNGRSNINVDANYAQNEPAYFSICPQVAGQNQSGLTLPNNCRPS